MSAVIIRNLLPTIAIRCLDGLLRNSRGLTGFSTPYALAISLDGTDRIASIFRKASYGCLLQHYSRHSHMFNQNSERGHRYSWTGEPT